MGVGKFIRPLKDALANLPTYLRRLREAFAKMARKNGDDSDTTDEMDHLGVSGSSGGDTQIPRPETLDADGNIDWSQAPEGGFTLDAGGRPITQDHVPAAGDMFDRYGTPDGRYVSPIEADGPFSYDSRSLPYTENPNAYHQYEWAQSPADIDSVYDSLDDATRGDLDAILDKYDLDVSDLGSVTRGEAAAIPAWGTSGGATQDVLPVSVDVLISIGLVREVG